MRVPYYRAWLSRPDFRHPPAPWSCRPALFMPATFRVSMPRVARTFAYPLGLVTVPSNLLAANPVAGEEGASADPVLPEEHRLAGLDLGVRPAGAGVAVVAAGSLGHELADLSDEGQGGTDAPGGVALPSPVRGTSATDWSGRRPVRSSSGGCKRTWRYPRSAGHCSPACR